MEAITAHAAVAQDHRTDTNRSGSLTRGTPSSAIDNNVKSFEQASRGTGMTSNLPAEYALLPAGQVEEEELLSNIPEQPPGA